MIGRKISKEENESMRRNTKETFLLDFYRSKIYLPKDFYSEKFPEPTLEWEELSLLSSESRGSSSNIHCFKEGHGQRFDSFLDDILQDLTKKGFFTEEYPQIGDYYFIDNGGINLTLAGGQDPHGRTGFYTKFYYPKQEIDATLYAKHFLKAWTPIAKIISVNKPN